MGQLESHVYEGPPSTLEERSLAAVASLIKNGEAKRIVVMTGAGISTAAGIPDFRSPDTGLYANLARLDLPHAEAVFDISYFRQNPRPFYVLAKELYPGKFFPTVSHAFISLLASKGLLHMLFTQNIDCLERRAGVPVEKIIEAHGSFATQRCIECKNPFDDELMKTHVERGEVPTCRADGCQGLVKPDIVFFGESLPSTFDMNRYNAAMADLVLIIGTSLTVWPFAGLPDLAKETTPRVLFNMEKVGSIGSRSDDVMELGPCDSGIRKLADELGWREELEQLWRSIVGDEEAERQLSAPEIKRENLVEKDEELIKALTAGVEDVHIRQGSEESSSAFPAGFGRTASSYSFSSNTARNGSDSHLESHLQRNSEAGESRDALDSPDRSGYGTSLEQGASPTGSKERDLPGNSEKTSSSNEKSVSGPLEPTNTTGECRDEPV